MRPLGPWPADRQVAVAVSGGADSLCLALLVRGWAATGRSPFALVVDHGLRAGSDREAAAAVAVLAGLKIGSRVLSLGMTAGAGLQARARDVRHAALTAACAEAGLPDLLLGHHRDDQDETLAMRARAGSGPDGLAGMSLLSERHRVRLVRPLLSVRSARLRATLRAAGVSWVEDPSNADPRFERARLRGRVGWEVAAERAPARNADADWLARHVVLHEAGFALLPPGPVPAAVLSRLLQTIAGRKHPPPRAAVEKLAAWPAPATLHGARLIKAGRLGPGMVICREAAAMAGPVPAVTGAVWDRRFRLISAVPHGWMLGPFIGQAARRPRLLPGPVRETLAALYDATGSLQAAPHAGIVSDTREIEVIFTPALPAAPSFFTIGRQSAS